MGLLGKRYTFKVGKDVFELKATDIINTLLYQSSMEQIYEIINVLSDKVKSIDKCIGSSIDKTQWNKVMANIHTAIETLKESVRLIQEQLIKSGDDK